MTPIVFLHGFLGSPRDWDPVLTCLGETVYEAIELPIASDWTDAVHQTLKALPDRCRLVGYSMGARLALGCVVEAPDRFERLCFVAGNPGLPDALRPARRKLDEQLACRLEREPIQAVLADWYNQPLFAQVDRSARARWVQDRASLNAVEQAQLLRGLSIAGQPNYWNDLASIQTPTLVVVGENDPKYVAISSAMIKTSAAITRQIVGAAGHAIIREHPESLARIIEKLFVQWQDRTDSEESL